MFLLKNVRPQRIETGYRGSLAESRLDQRYRVTSARQPPLSCDMSRDISYAGQMFWLHMPSPINRNRPASPREQETSAQAVGTENRSGREPRVGGGPGERRSSTLSQQPMTRAVCLARAYNSPATSLLLTHKPKVHNRVTPGEMADQPFAEEDFLKYSSLSQRKVNCTSKS